MSDQERENDQPKPVGGVTRRETDETVAPGKGDPDFGHKHPFQVQAGQFHVTFSSGRSAGLFQRAI